MPPLLGAHSRIVIISLVLFSRSEQFYGLGAGLCGVHGLKVFLLLIFHALLCPTVTVLLEYLNPVNYNCLVSVGSCTAIGFYQKALIG